MKFEHIDQVMEFVIQNFTPGELYPELMEVARKMADALAYDEMNNELTKEFDYQYKAAIDLVMANSQPL